MCIRGTAGECVQTGAKSIRIIWSRGERFSAGLITVIQPRDRFQIYSGSSGGGAGSTRLTQSRIIRWPGIYYSTCVTCRLRHYIARMSRASFDLSSIHGHLFRYGYFLPRDEALFA